MLQTEYLKKVQEFTDRYDQDIQFHSYLQDNVDICTIMENMNLDPASAILTPLYCPVKHGDFRDPICMLRSLILMTILKIKGITEWVRQTRTYALLAILAGFEPDNTPGIGTYYDFLKRIYDGPYQKPCQHICKKSDTLTSLHKRNIKQEAEDKKNSFEPYNSQSKQLSEHLLANSDKPRTNDYSKILEDLLVKLGIMPTIEQGILDTENITASGHGSILKTNASGSGKPACSCRKEGSYKCNCPKYYTSPTAKWCYNHHTGSFEFGDRYYHIVTAQNGHDIPLHVSMPGGNESDYTLSIDAVDSLLKTIRENGINMTIKYFAGDGHHDSQAHYIYFKEKNIVPVIPLSENTKQVITHLEKVTLDDDGTPLCPAGMKMRYHGFNQKKQAHTYCCPVKRSAHKDGKYVYVTHLDECPNKEDCRPDTKMAPVIYLKLDTDPRLFPPLSRDSKKFKDLMKERTASERVNSVIDSYHLDNACRNAVYGLIRLTFINIAIHARIRYEELLKNSSKEELFVKAMSHQDIKPEQPRLNNKKLT